ncbi:type IV secretion system protein [Paraburkholderia nodosa]|uniref:type IV secretion system protein n=1 Tax=Paraburkholderia nodosa TaxID=392320 RepID=UPI000480F0C1|nr:type IV secretion system protein [Paraburkholderia nodosa]
MSGLFTAVGGTLENGMSTYVTSVSSALSSALVPVVTTALTIWVIAYGFAVVRGEAHESVPAFVWRAMRVAITLAFALGAGLYQSQVVAAVEGATTGLAQTIQIAAANAGAGNAGCGTVSGSEVAGTSASAIYQTLDCYDRQIDIVMDAYFDRATHEGLSVSGFVAGIGDLAGGFIVGLGGAIFLMVLAFEVTMARMLLDLVLGLGPVFIACGAFGPTARFFEAWTAKVTNYALLQILIAAFLGMALTAFSADLAPFNVTTSSPDANASALSAAGQAVLTAVAPWGAAFGLLITSLFLAMIGWQLPAVASGLAGGATVSGFGAFIAGFASRGAVGGLGTLVRLGHGPRRPGGRIDNGGRASGGKAVSGAGQIPVYQRAAREHLGDQENT